MLCRISYIAGLEHYGRVSHFSVSYPFFQFSRVHTICVSICICFLVTWMPSHYYLFKLTFHFILNSILTQGTYKLWNAVYHGYYPNTTHFSFKLQLYANFVNRIQLDMSYNIGRGTTFLSILQTRQACLVPTWDGGYEDKS